MLSLNLKATTIKEACKEIEKQTGFVFVFADNTEAATVKKVDIQVNNESITAIMDKLLSNTDLTYKILDKQVVILHGKASSVNSTASTSVSRVNQQRSIEVRGIVQDTEGSPLPGVTIVVEGSSRGVITDNDGVYRIDVQPTDKLVFTFVGLESQTIEVDNRRAIDVVMREKTDELQEVTIVAYGKQRKESVIGAISGLSVDDIKMPAGKLSTALAGQIAGIVSVQSTGEPGSSSNFWIRGISTFGDYNKPLILVDGIERDLDLVDSDDIESFSILKDATATAVYGVRGANGIVLITTKKGKESTKPAIQAKLEYGYSNPVKLPKLANAAQWIDFYNDVNYDISGFYPISAEEKEKYLDGSDPDLYPNVDWMKEVFKEATPNSRASVSVTGGSNIFKYYVSGNFYREEGMYAPIKNDIYDNSVAFNRFSFRSNIDVSITKSTLLTLNLANQYDTRNRLGANHTDLWTGVLQTPAISYPTIYSDGSYARMKPSNSRNPYYDLNFTGYSRDTWFNSQSLISLTQDFSDIITPGLTANVKFSWDAQSANVIDQRKTPSTYFALGRDEEGYLIFEETRTGSDYLQLNRTNSGWKATDFEASVIYDRVFNHHRVGSMFLFSMRQHTNDFPADFIAAIPNRNTGIAGRATYSFKDRYFIEGNFGYNGSENFAPKHRFGFFPSVAVGYLVSNEDYFQSLVSTIHLLKLKTSYGIIGNDQIGGDRRFAFNTEMNGDAEGWIFGSSGQASYTGITTGHPGNPNVAWEEAKKFNCGLEIGLFNSLRLDLDYFFERRDGIYIQQESVPSIVGNNVKQYVNLGKMQNQGFDSSLEFYKSFGDLFVSTRGNFTFNRNKKLYDDKPTPTWAYQEEVNTPHLQQRGLIALGLFESEEEIATSPSQSAFGKARVGDIKYKDINGDGVIDQFDFIPIGYSSIPEISYGFGPSISYKGFDVSAFFQGVANVTKFIEGNSIFGSSGNLLISGQIFSEVADKRWTLRDPNPQAEFPRLSVDINHNNRQRSTYWQRDMSFLRLKNVELGYTLPKKVTERFDIKTIRFYVTGVNLLTFSRFKMWDPESGGTTGGSYPMMKSLNLGLNINF
ncbi:SusC/RagA family TonB-linked outer membrane protein [Proteiniphilum sp. X52]|nr:SusC/RagA family TonB-linked outer membrane protein [Proteiniphilum sp. X52]